MEAPPSMPAALHSYPPPPLAMPAMPAFAPTPGPTTTAQQQQEETDRARAYKSRNKRPCDFCRWVGSAVWSLEDVGAGLTGIREQIQKGSLPPRPRSTL